MMKKVESLRKKHPRFVYRGYSYRVTHGNLEIDFDFCIEPNIQLKPKLVIKNIAQARLEKLGDRVLDTLVFHLGLMEIPSYWKLTCSKDIVIEAGHIIKEQQEWWKDLILNGMGQFFYENKIDWRATDFLRIKPQSIKTYKRFPGKLKNKYLVPIGGGKDSIVTLERLKKYKANAFVVNPTRFTRNVLNKAKIKNPIIVERKLDKTLLRMNEKGYLNGHTPFTALLSFLSVFCAVLFDYKHIAFSNEKSANEGNVEYLGKTINHQYSKSSVFEKKFKDYSYKYLAKNIHYFSYLRSYTELEISKLFSKYTKYFPVFSSCNLGPKKGKKWCCKCPKCLFVYTTLYPFLEKKELVKIFGKDLFQNKELLPIMKSLIGKGKTKPFECVGTYRESRQAFNLSLKKDKKAGDMPYLLERFNEIKRTQG